MLEGCEDVLVTCWSMREEREGLGEGEEWRKDVEDSTTSGGAGKKRKTLNSFSNTLLSLPPLTHVSRTARHRCRGYKNQLCEH